MATELRERVNQKLQAYGLVNLFQVISTHNPAHNLYLVINRPSLNLGELSVAIERLSRTQLHGAQSITRTAKVLLVTAGLERMCLNLPNTLVTILSNFLPLNYFSLAPVARAEVLNGLRSNDMFIGILSCFPDQAKAFLIESVRENHSLNNTAYNLLIQHRLQIFLLPQFAHKIPELRHNFSRFLLPGANRRATPAQAAPRPVVPADMGQTVRRADLSATQVFSQENTVIDNEVLNELLDDFRCPITLSLIVGDACKVQLVNGNFQYYSVAALSEWIQRSPHDAPKNPTTGHSLTQADIHSAKQEYRQAVLNILKDKLVELNQPETVALEIVNNWAKELQWPNLQLSSSPSPAQASPGAPPSLTFDGASGTPH